MSLQICMEETFQLRLSRHDRQMFERCARSRKMSLAAFLREAARAKAANATQRAACLDYDDEVELSREAEHDPKAYIRSKLKARHELHRRFSPATRC